MSVLRVTPPCWSCEGHEDQSGQLLKPPRVWFTTRALAHADVINECLSKLRIEQQLAADWQLVVVDWGAHDEITFSIEPQATAKGYTVLALLRRDARRIAERLPDLTKALAGNRLTATSMS